MVVRARRPAARARPAAQIALAIRDEVRDLEAAGIGIIQIDEPALREGLPLRRGGLGRLSRLGRRRASASPPPACADDDPDPHAHVLLRVQRHHRRDRRAGRRRDLDRDRALATWSCSTRFGDVRYPNEIGPGVYDIHSPRVPRRDEMERLLRKAARRDPGRAALGQSRLRPEDARLAGDGSRRCATWWRRRGCCARSATALMRAPPS